MRHPRDWWSDLCPDCQVRRMVDSCQHGCEITSGRRVDPGPADCEHPPGEASR